MTLIDRIRNSIPRIGDGIINTGNVTDRGVGGYGVTTESTDNTRTLQDLTDLTIVRKTIQNARLAVEIDPTTYSSIMALTILANKDYEIVGDPEADEDAVSHLRMKSKEWELPKQMITSTWKGLIDGRCFIEKYLTPESVGINHILHLAYDDYYYNFIEVRNPNDGQLLGYKQKARVYPVPKDWEGMTFDAMKTRTDKYVEVTFTPDGDGWFNVFMPQLLQGDGNSEGFVFKVLDDVYCLKSIKNMMPDAAKMAANTVKVQVGNKDFPFKPFNDGDPVEEKITKSEDRMAVIGSNFADKFKKQAILHDGSVSADMLGNGQLPELERYIDLFKQEIRVSLQTPDSRFESASSNRAVAQEQLSGDMGQVKVLDYIRDQYLRPYYERNLFDHELFLQGYESSMGLIHIEYEEDSKEDEVSLSTIAKTILDIRPDLFDIIAPIYYPKLKGEINPDTSTGTPEEMVKNSLGHPDNHNPAGYVLGVKRELEREGLLI